MVIIVGGAQESVRNAVCRLLAEALGWEFVDAENLHPPERLDRRRWSTSLANADPHSRIETLSAAITLWIYEWRDLVVSCPVLTERDRTQLSKVSSLVKLVCLEASPTTGQSPLLNQSTCVAHSEETAGWHASCEPGQDVLTVDSSRQVEEVIAEITALLIMRKPNCLAAYCSPPGDGSRGATR